MENNYEVNIVSLEMDRDAEASAESQSESSSSLSNSLESRGDDPDSNLEDECGVWTNEKHSSYLDSLENSFVRQLYSLLGREETRSVSRTSVSRTRHVQSNSHKSTDQFILLQNGCRQKVNFGKKRSHLATSSEYAIGNTDQGNVSCKEENEISCDKAFTRTSRRNSLGHEYPARCNAEASGQNFREEGCNSGVSRKRRREANYDESSLNDQVVPLGR